jgi:hypothetical protein
MLDGDDAESQGYAADVGLKARHYWEEEGWPVSARLRPMLGIGPYDPTRSAWDVYLLYDGTAMWVPGRPPAPVAWAYNTQADLPAGERLDAVLLHRWSLSVRPS